MLRAVLLAAVLLLGMTGTSAAQSSFDATGQFTLSFKFGLPGEAEEKPTLGFRIGASNVPQVHIEESDPTRSALNLDFDRRDYTMTNFAGVEVKFGEADKETIRLLDDPFSPAALGLDVGDSVVDLEQEPIAGYLKGRPTTADDGSWGFGADRQSGFGWTTTPLSD